MARKAGQVISSGPRTWPIRVWLGRDLETGNTTAKLFGDHFANPNPTLAESCKSARLGVSPAQQQYGSISTWISGSQRQPSLGYGRKATPITKHCCGFIPAQVSGRGLSAQSHNSTLRASILACLSVGCPRERSNIRRQCCSPRSGRLSTAKCWLRIYALVWICHG